MIGSLQAQKSLPTEPTYTIQGGVKNGAYVAVGDNKLVYTSPDGLTLPASEDFLTEATDWRPTGTIVCSWSPDGKYLAIFIPHPRVTTITLINIQENKVLNEEFPENRQFPKWYMDSNILATHDSPQKWENNKLTIKTEVTLPNNTSKLLPRVLVVSSDSFQILCSDVAKDPAPNKNGPIPQTIPKPTKPPQTSLEWN